MSLISPLWSIAQQKFSISGSIKDITSGEELIGAAVLVKELPGTGVVANAYGFYSLELPAGQYTIRFQYTGYELKEQIVKLDKNFTNKKRNFYKKTDRMLPSCTNVQVFMRNLVKSSVFQ
jgi:hypothetical protein